MVVTNFWSHPNDNGGFKPGGIGNQLPKVLVVGGIKLAFYNYDSIAPPNSAKNVQFVRTDSLFSLFDFNGNSNQAGKMFDVLREPRSEVPFLILPDFFNALCLDATEFDFRHSGSFHVGSGTGMLEMIGDSQLHRHCFLQK